MAFEHFRHRTRTTGIIIEKGVHIMDSRFSKKALILAFEFGVLHRGMNKFKEFSSSWQKIFIIPLRNAGAHGVGLIVLTRGSLA
jgi:hypothetical protein